MPVMPWWATMLISVATAVLTLIATTVTTYILNSPKRKKEEERRKKEEDQRETQKILDKIDNLKSELDRRIDDQDAQRAQLRDNVGLLKLGSQALLKNELKLRYEEWLRKGYAPIDAKDDLERMYQVYHSLGANGVMDHLRASFLDLPDERVVKKKKIPLEDGENK